MSKVKYPTYKPSKTLWQEQIPSHWQVTELRMLFADNKNKNIGLVERNLLSLSYGKLKRKDIDNATGLVPASFEGYQIIDEDYIVLRFTDLQNDKKSLRVGYANEKGIITNAYIGLAPKADIHSKYFYYQLHFLDKIKYFYNLGGGVRQSLAYKEFGRETLLIPNKVEQIAIANFLDFKLAKIDRFIRKKKQLIKLLNEKKAAIINQFVTKGLDPNVKMKDSGVSEIGLIPVHWKIKKFKHAVFYQEGPGLRNWQFKEVGIKVICVSNIVPPIISFEKLQRHISVAEYNEAYKHFTVKKNDIVIASSGASWGKVSRFTLEDTVILNTSTIRMRSKVKDELLDDFLEYLLQSQYLKMQLQNLLTGSCQPNFGPSHLHKLICVIPELEQQKIIVLQIKDEVGTIDDIISKIEKEIALVEEYKTAIIAEAVTGKKDVRDFEIPKTLEEESYGELEEELSIAAEDETEYETEEID